jgi:hypothetical protein
VLSILILLIVAMLPMWALGTFIFVQLLKPAALPADQSNRINKIRLLWFALTRPELFAGWFEWMRHDELDNVNNKKGS